MAYCKHCGTNNGDDVKFCTSCGQPMTASNEQKAPEQKNEQTVPEKEQLSAQAQPAPQNESANSYQNQQQPHVQDPNPYQQAQAQYQAPPMQNPNPYQQQYQQYQQPGNGYYAPQSFADPYAEPPKGSRYAPLSPWAYMGYFLLFSIPCIGLIALIVLAFVGDNENRKNFARGYLLYGLIITLISIITLIGAGAAIGSIIEDIIYEFGGMYY
ncbi:MAG: zinc ribbon domain-containing protein [Ruminococcaceae bacterium]|nr:zinc ribbon domain-containing protein [Oscillospiraceae bacterium]